MRSRHAYVVPVVVGLGIGCSAACGGADTAVADDPDSSSSGSLSSSGTSSGSGSSSSGSSSGSTSGGSSSGAPAEYRLAGTVVGLLGEGLALVNAGSAPLPIAAAAPPGSDVAFEFPARLRQGESFAVSVATQPSSPTQTCVVEGGTGQVVAGDITNVVVNCTTGRFTIGGTVSGLVDEGVVLEDQDGNEITVNDNGEFAFPEAVPSGTAYAVTVKTHPGTPPQECSVSNGSGLVGGANVNTIEVSCGPRPFAVRGTVVGLAGSGATLTLGNETIDLEANGPFAFQTLVPSGQPWSIAVSAQPANPTQVCTVVPASGVVGGADVQIAVSCEISRFRLRGTVSGLVAGDSVTVWSAGTSVPFAADGPFDLGELLSGSAYSVMALSSTTYCEVRNGTGTVGGGDAVVEIVCARNRVRANGLNWYVNNNACGQPCNEVCAGVGLVPADDATVFEAQNTVEKCQVISQALGMGNIVDHGGWTYGCLQDSAGNHTVGGPLRQFLQCSREPTCPAEHRTRMDNQGVPCGAGSRRSICACE